MPEQCILVTGATGYIGGRLAPRLLEKGHRVRGMARNPDKLACRSFAAHERFEVAGGDVLDPQALGKALANVDTAFYLIHSMAPGNEDFAAIDRKAAEIFIRAADACKVRRIIYLSGLGGDETGGNGPESSAHLRSRAEVARILSSGRAETTVLRAAQILGAGSASFEIVRYLVERLPVMITPRWVSTETQPISVSDVLAYLEGCLEHPETAGRSFDVGGPDVLSYRDLFHLYCECAGIPRRIILPVPVLTPALSAYWVSLFTPLPASLIRPLIRGLGERVVCRENSIRDVIPLKLTDCRTAITLALDSVRQHSVDTCWSDAGDPRPPEWIACGDATYAGGTIFEAAYSARVKADPEQAWKPIVSIGGDSGWYCCDWLWRLRGWMDKLVGGVGLRRGRRHPTELHKGDALDFWRVLDVQENRRLLLLAEMKVFGEAMLEFSIVPGGPGECEIRQRSRYLPRGLSGIVYWYLSYPFHLVIFPGLLKCLARQMGAELIGRVDTFDPQKDASCRLS